LAADSGELARRRRGPGWGEGRGGRREPVGGLGVCGGGLWRLTGDGQGAAAVCGGSSATPASLGGDGRASEHQWETGN